MNSEIVVADAKRFADEANDRETVLIDTSSGVLYLLTGLATWLWARAKTPVPSTMLEAEVNARFGTEASAAAARFLSEMEAEGILITASAAASAHGTEAVIPDSYAPPALEKFEDIADILTMDPIHDVTPDAGWPFGRK